ncbi:hypothetical protein SODALDRAFT_362586 [Sodiomyces alkalinus F11]|uniref:Uncharacterized protein n=1 Tax=Sodiomyces alkalinus (strain CBS 110278 / VKM F-3762 / F11) TaxID=1314773 RepID=A0A3N2PMK5_SODAK|nr:hypothetical protein SODALDRAFT_362586 [Sodiomyces alkalinus F11]ROT35757.1 hypothetical protein SODALDRAFT_362586 [Sodiomyces alkalinus F11]
MKCLHNRPNTASSTLSGKSKHSHSPPELSVTYDSPPHTLIFDVLYLNNSHDVVIADPTGRHPTQLAHKQGKDASQIETRSLPPCFNEGCVCLSGNLPLDGLRLPLLLALTLSALYAIRDVEFNGDRRRPDSYGLRRLFAGTQQHTYFFVFTSVYHVAIEDRGSNGPEHVGQESQKKNKGPPTNTMHTSSD